MSVVRLVDGPSLADVPGMLRKLADAIEGGVHGEVASALVLIPRDGDYPAVFGYGAQDGERHPIVVMEMARVWFASRLVVR